MQIPDKQGFLKDDAAAIAERGRSARRGTAQGTETGPYGTGRPCPEAALPGAGSPGGRGDTGRGSVRPRRDATRGCVLCRESCRQCRWRREGDSCPVRAGSGAGTARGAEGPGHGTTPTEGAGRRVESVMERPTTELSRRERLRTGGSGVPVLTFCGAADACPSCRPPRTAWAAACGPAGPVLPGRREQPGAGVSGSRGDPPLPSRRPAQHSTARYLCASSSPRSTRNSAAAPLLAAPCRARPRQSRPHAGYRPTGRQRQQHPHPPRRPPRAAPPTAQARRCWRGRGRKGGGGAAAGGGAAGGGRERT